MADKLEQLSGRVALTKRVRRHEVWTHDPANYASAWCDLLLLANDEQRTVHLRGEPVVLERGQLAWSQLGLAKEWSRSPEWVAAFLKFCVSQQMVRVETSHRKTVITILNYDLYNPAQPATETATVPATETASEPVRNGKGNREVEGEGVPPADIPDGDGGLKNAATRSQAIEWFASNGSGYTGEEVGSAWDELTAAAVDGYWMTGGRVPRPVADWRSALGSELWKRRQIFGQKNSARSAQSRQLDGEPPRPAVLPDFKLSTMRMPE